MIKYKDIYIVFEEIPDQITLAINITNCTGRCVGCHSPELRADLGCELTENVLDEMIARNYGINCVCFMGEGTDPERIVELATHIKRVHGFKVAIYVGVEECYQPYWGVFDYIKLGPYMPEFGPLNSRTTNQKMWKCNDAREWEDITHMFWERK